MGNVIRYRGRDYSEREIEEVRELIAACRGKSRFFLSKELCRRWNWTQANGTPRDMLCRGLLLKLDREGRITLPPRKREPTWLLSRRQAPEPIDVDEHPVAGPLSCVVPVRLHMVRGSPEEGLYRSLIHRYHYLGFTRPVGEHLEYIAFSAGTPLACLGWSSAPRHIGCRDRHLGWTKTERAANLDKLAVNTRFLILPWVRIPHLASHLLGLMAQQLPSDWLAIYRHRIVWLETFVDPEKGFTGTCYKAANWRYLGLTTGRGKADRLHRPNRSKKYVFGYPLTKDFRKALYGVL